MPSNADRPAAPPASETDASDASQASNADLDASARGTAFGDPSAIDGVPVGATVAPTTAEETAALLLDAAERGLAVAPVGGGTALALGNPPQRVDLALATRRLGGIIDYEPTDLVLSVGAGARLGDVLAVLAEHGQGLPVDPPGGDDATVGGLIATALTGPRRTGAGSLRDLLIGIAVAHPSGTVTRAGGMVVKNVSGFDLPRLYHGSLGTLGLIVSANFKVLPLARAERTLLAEYGGLDAAFAAAKRVRESRIQPAALEVTLLGETATLAVRVTGRDQVIDAVASELDALLAADTRHLDGSDQADWWVAYIERQRISSGADDVLLRAAVRPRGTGTLAEGIVAALPVLEARLDSLAASPALGIVVARVRLANGSPERLAELQAVLGVLADHLAILAAPPAWKRGIDVWGRPPDAFDVMRSLKEQFDPQRVLNPGRFAGFL